MSLGNPAALTRSGCPTRAGAAGRRAGRRLGRRRCGPTSRCERRGTCPPPACTSSPWGAQGEGLGRVHRRRAPPWVVQVLGGREAAWRGRGRVSYLFLFPGERPVGFGYERLQRRDVVVAQINLGQGQHVRGGNGGGGGGRRQRLPRGSTLPCCFGPRARRAAPRSVCRRRRIFCGKGTISLTVGHKPPTDCPCIPVPSPAPPLLPPPSPHPTCFFRSPVQPNFFPSAGFPVPPHSILINEKSASG